MQNDKRRNTLIALIGGGALVVLLIVVWIVSTVKNDSETGGLKDENGAAITTDISTVTDLGFPQKLYKDFSENFYQAMTVINPTCNKQAKAKNAKLNGDTYTFDIVRCNETYNVELTEDGNNYVFTIKKGTETLVTYDSKTKGKSYITASNISQYLPMNSQTQDGIKYVIKQSNKANPLELEIGVDSCGSQEKKNKAVESAKEVLEYTGFNPEEFTYITPNYCDANS